MHDEFTKRSAQLEQALFEMRRVVVGQDRVLERLMVALLAGGHTLLEGVPGLGKTLTLATLARVLGGSFSRIQFTPDLLPADIVGTRIFLASQEKFDVEPGPVLANFVLADEINRAPAKVQSAMLEVMQEHQVTIGDQTFPAPAPFLVMATQNPIESEGVYPLPEAQRDRFMMRVPVGYPSVDEEREIVRRMDVTASAAEPILDPADVLAMQKVAGDVFVDQKVVDYALRIVHRHPATRRRGDAAARGADRVRRQPTGQHRPRSAAPRRWGCSGAAATPYRRTCTRSPTTSSTTGWCCPTPPSPTASPSTTCWSTSSPSCPPRASP